LKTSHNVKFQNYKILNSNFIIKKYFILLLSFFLILVSSTSAYAATKVFYLDLKRGCYSYTPNGKGKFLVTDINYKYLYKSNCKSSHHVEVIWAGKIRPADGSSSPTQEDAYGVCDDKYFRVMGFYAPTETPTSDPYLRWFFADAGKENRKFGAKVICLIGKSDNSWDYYVPVKGRLIGL
jgi:hypothetical protein